MTSFQDPSRDVSWKELSDGHLLWSVLRDIDPDYFDQPLPEPTVDSSSDWTRRWQNLKFISRHVSTYYRDVCSSQDEPSRATMPDVKAIAAENSVRDAEVLIMTILRLAMASPASNQRMAQRLMGLGPKNAMVVAGELKRMEEADRAEVEENRDTIEDYRQAGAEEYEDMPDKTANGRTMYRDPQLEQEEELLQAHGTIDRLQALNARAESQLRELRRDKDSLQEAFDLYRSEIDAKGKKTASEEAVKRLQRQTDNDREYIAELESQLEATRSAAEAHERQLERYKTDNEASHKLRDDLQVLRAENDDLVQKIKANENLKKKIQMLQEHEKANTVLREDLKNAHEQLDDLEKLKQAQAILEKEVIEKKGLIRNQEYQINELTTTRKHAEYDARVLAQKLESARERHDRDHEAMTELQEKLQGIHISRESDIAPPKELDNELAASEREPQRLVVTDVNRPEPLADLLSIKHSTDESKLLSEKLIMVEQQLEQADSRLKELSDRNAALEARRESFESSIERQRAQNSSYERVSAYSNTPLRPYARSTMYKSTFLSHAGVGTDSSSQRVEEQDILIADLKERLEAASKPKV